MINRSKAYIAPLVLEKLVELPFSTVKNTYIYSDFRPLEPTIYLLINGGIGKELIASLFKYEEIEDIFFLGGDYLMVTNLNSEYHYEYLCFTRGNYSWYRPETKLKILNYLIGNVGARSMGMVDKIKSVFSRDPMLKKYYEGILDVKMKEDAELGSRMEETGETFNSKTNEQFTQLRRETEAVAE